MIIATTMLVVVVMLRVVMMLPLMMVVLAMVMMVVATFEIRKLVSEIFAVLLREPIRECYRLRFSGTLAQRKRVLEHLIPGVAEQEVVARAAIESVIATPAKQRVIASCADYKIVLLISHQEFVG